MRTLAIGDIHGCYSALETLLQAAKVAPDDFLVFLGDYIDRGPESKAVVSRVINFCKQQSAITLRGNHEVMILQAREDPLQAKLWSSYGGDEALHSYGAGYSEAWQNFIPDEHWKFYEQTRPWFETETHLFVHATVSSELSMQEQPDYLLYWERFNENLRHRSGKIVVCGHTPQHSGWPTRGAGSICIDTGVNSGKWLTCLDVDSGSFWQANEGRMVRAGKLLPSH
jgi:serine/threonine protein phosphatase 1